MRLLKLKLIWLTMHFKFSFELTSEVLDIKFGQDWAFVLHSSRVTSIVLARKSVNILMRWMFLFISVEITWSWRDGENEPIARDVTATQIISESHKIGINSKSFINFYFARLVSSRWLFLLTANNQTHLLSLITSFLLKCFECIWHYYLKRLEKPSRLAR